jgi:predicted DNA-binding ribbon-helix-helix protein
MSPAFLRVAQATLFVDETPSPFVRPSDMNYALPPSSGLFDAGYHRVQSLALLRPVVVSRSVSIKGRSTIVTLERALWSGLKDIARTRHTSIDRLVERIASKCSPSNLASSIRYFVLEYDRSRPAK